MRDLRPGDHILLGAHVRHRVEWTDADTPTVWLAVHYGAPTKGIRGTADVPEH